MPKKVTEPPEVPKLPVLQVTEPPEVPKPPVSPQPRRPRAQLNIPLNRKTFTVFAIIAFSIGALAFIPAHKDQKFTERLEIMVKTASFVLVSLIMTQIMVYEFQALSMLLKLSRSAMMVSLVATMVLCVAYYFILYFLVGMI